MIETNTLIKRSLRCKCPSCGEGKLYRAYLKPVQECAKCGEKLGHIRADDGPAWLTILLLGHILVPVAIEVEYHYSLQPWQSALLWGLSALALILLMLPFSKALFIGFIWRSGCEGSEKTV